MGNSNDTEAIRKLTKLNAEQARSRNLDLRTKLWLGSVMTTLAVSTLLGSSVALSDRTFALTLMFVMTSVMFGYLMPMVVLAVCHTASKPTDRVGIAAKIVDVALGSGIGATLFSGALAVALLRLARVGDFAAGFFFMAACLVFSATLNLIRARRLVRWDMLLPITIGVYLVVCYASILKFGPHK